MKKINTEFIVGLFMLTGFLSFAYLSSQMGEFSVFSLERNYQIEAEFEMFQASRSERQWR